MTKIVIDKRGNVFKYDGCCPIVESGIDSQYDSLEEFKRSITNECLRDLHQRHLRSELRANDFEITCEVLWSKLLEIAADRTRASETWGRRDPSTGRRSQLGKRRYALLKFTCSLPRTRQARVCLQIIEECVDDTRQVTETTLKQSIIDRADELKTAQDPWRIFQYYRQELIRGGFIQMVLEVSNE